MFTLVCNVGKKKCSPSKVYIFNVNFRIIVQQYRRLGRCDVVLRLVDRVVGAPRAMASPKASAIAVTGRSTYGVRCHSKRIMLIRNRIRIAYAFIFSQQAIPSLHGVSSQFWSATRRSATRPLTRAMGPPSLAVRLFP